MFWKVFLPSPFYHQIKDNCDLAVRDVGTQSVNCISLFPFMRQSYNEDRSVGSAREKLENLRVQYSSGMTLPHRRYNYFAGTFLRNESDETLEGTIFLSTRTLTLSDSSQRQGY